MLPLLADTPDNFEVIRDRIALILANESANQVELATLAAIDPAVYTLNIYTERATPWENWLNVEAEDLDPAPIINVFFAADQFNPSASNTHEFQATNGAYNIDCYGLGLAQDTDEGHLSADEAAAAESHRAARLVRKILMASENNYLGLRGTVGRRWVESRTSFLPQKELTPLQRIVVTRLVLQVGFIETAPQYVGQECELLHINLKRAADGRVLAELEYAVT